MNAKEIILAIICIALLGLVAAAVVTLGERTKTHPDDALRCVAVGGKPVRIEGTTYCLNAQLFVPN